MVVEPEFMLGHMLQVNCLCESKWLQVRVACLVWEKYTGAHTKGRREKEALSSSTEFGITSSRLSCKLNLGSNMSRV